MDPKNKTMLISESDLEPVTAEELAEQDPETKNTESDSALRDDSTRPIGKQTKKKPKRDVNVVPTSSKTIALELITKPPPFPKPPTSRTGVSSPLSNQIIDSRYQVCECLGQGAMGAVYEVRHLRLDKLFAMKIIHPTLAKQEKLVARFQREAAALSRLDHPNCVQVTDFGQTPNGDLYLVMERVEGAILSDVVDQGPLNVTEAIEVTKQTLLGLGHAHNAGIIHRDIKLENLIKTKSEQGPFRIKILDFGLAKEEMPSSHQNVLTEVGEVLGTPQYIAPETIMTQTVNQQTDLYAVGVALFYMLIGGPVFAGRGPLEILQFKVQNPPPKLRDMGREKFPLPLEDFLVKALAEPDKRFATAAEMLDALESVAEQISGSKTLGHLLKQTKITQATAAAIKYGERVTISAVARGKKVGHAMRSQFHQWWESKRSDGETPWTALVKNTKTVFTQSIKRLTSRPPDDPDTHS